MKRKHRRLVVLLGALAVLGAAAGLLLNAIGDSLVFFYSPSELAAKDLPAGQLVRIGGLVEEGSVARSDDGATIRFRVTDLKQAVPVVYTGLLPDLFREGQGVVVQGRLGSDGVFHAREVLAKHDERYMPREVAEALKKSGEWRPADTP
ncbi:MAG: cytochrome c maturation protein CcmE [Rhodospirillaceae bacterium]|nr:cytochrome c maturation protein CcmE [Rhodospirillaceae bacterium]